MANSIQMPVQARLETFCDQLTRDSPRRAYRALLITGGTAKPFVEHWAELQQSWLLCSLTSAKKGMPASAIFAGSCLQYFSRSFKKA